ncbi:MAG: MDR/zinc-dependent alcohol dehydrogenase-like family protein [Desulfobaccales bacterium]
MQALYVDGRLERRELPLPEAKPGEALVQVRLAGICGSDREILKGYHDFRGIPGHEFVGQVVAPPRSPFLGQRVVGEINLPCGACSHCLQGLERHCLNRRVLGLLGKDGAFAEYLTLPEKNLYPVPAALPDEAAVFTEPLAAALAVSDAAPIHFDQRVLIIGDGTLGLLIAFTLGGRGLDTTLVGHYQEHLRLAEPYGVRGFLEPALPPGEFDLVVEASGSPGGLALALKRVRPRGTVVLKSTYVGHFPLDPALVVVPEVRLAGSRCGPFPAALRLLEQGRLDPRPLISRIFPLAEGMAAFQHSQQPGVLKVLLAPGSG